MTERKPGFRSALLALHREELEVGEHLSSEEVEGYLQSTLSPQRQEELQTHLTICPGCLELIHEAQVLAEHDPESVSGTSEIETERALRHLRRTLTEDPDEPETAIAARAGPAWLPRWRSARVPYTLAATLLIGGVVAVLVFSQPAPTPTPTPPDRGSRVVELEGELRRAREGRRAAVGSLETARREVERLEDKVSQLQESLAEVLRPQPNTPLVELRAIRPRGGSPAPPRILADQDTRWIHLLLEDPSEQGYPSYSARLSAGGEAIEVAGLHRNEHGYLTLTLPRETLPPGEYLVELMAARQGREETGVGQPLEPLARYRFVLLPVLEPGSRQP